ncbi:hypothetical protein SLS62_001809 [Diatrype stigma]|uniref:Uncharacterized protein n=1 Tax=Diatrype stigma TaxID=117547 RepID=A0AAN9YT41_9PEZI
MSGSRAPTFNTSGAASDKQKDQRQSYTMDEYLRSDGPPSERFFGSGNKGKNSREKEKNYKDKAKGHIEQFDRAFGRSSGGGSR